MQTKIYCSESISMQPIGKNTQKKYATRMKSAKKSRGAEQTTSEHINQPTIHGPPTVAKSLLLELVGQNLCL
jgi:hypothetical protein